MASIVTKGASWTKVMPETSTKHRELDEPGYGKHPALHSTKLSSIQIMFPYAPASRGRREQPAHTVGYTVFPGTKFALICSEQDSEGEDHVTVMTGYEQPPFEQRLLRRPNSESTSICFVHSASGATVESRQKVTVLAFDESHYGNVAHMQVTADGAFEVTRDGGATVKVYDVDLTDLEERPAKLTLGSEQ